jgi:hypothetical protein
MSDGLVPNPENAKHVKCPDKDHCRWAGWVQCTACTRSSGDKIGSERKDYYEYYESDE